MSDSKPKTADWAPGTLDKTRKAIGQIDEVEAEKMRTVLGGEVMYEKTDDFSSPRTAKGTGRLIRQTAAQDSPQKETAEVQAPKPGKGRKNQEELISVSSKVSSQIDKLMMSDEYGIKPDYGLFNFIKYFQTNGHEQVISEFCTLTIKMHLDSLQNFITVIKTLIQIAPSSYKAKIAGGTEPKFKFLRMVAGWTLQGLKLTYMDLMNQNQPYFVTDLIPYTRGIYRLLIQVYYYGETKIPKLIKEIYADEAAYPDAPKDKLSGMAKEAITQWLYIQNEIIKKMYPLLMRMCSNTFEEYPDFFKVKVADILKFVGLHKYDLLLKEKQPEQNEEEKAKKEKKAAVAEKGVKDSLVTTGLTLLEQLFPQAGFKNLEDHPDFYPYFQPLYKFADGFNVLSPENPLQVTVVLLRIIEDFFQGCRNVKFTESKNSDSEKKDGDSILKILDDWTAYRETVFERLYCFALNDLVNQSYSQKDYEDSQYGKKLITSLLWQTNYHFLPHFKFEQLVLERPTDESKVPPLFKRTDFARSYLTSVVAKCDSLKKTHGSVDFVQNPWEHYKFDIPNEISKRLDVLLGAQNKNENTNANNANLLKYTLCILSVLDWWINNAESPAYSTSPRHIYRVSPEDGKPLFSVQERNDQNKLFAEQIRAAYQQKSAGKK